MLRLIGSRIEEDLTAAESAGVNAEIRYCMGVQIGRPAVVVGTSIGGATALDFALTHPEDVAALVLIDAQVKTRR